MATTAEKLINAVCEQKAVQVLLAPHMAELMGNAYGDVWASIKTYYSNYRTIPEITVLTERHPDFEAVEVDADAKYYLDQLRTEYVDRREDEILLKMVEAKKSGMSPFRALDGVQKSLAKLNKFTSNVKDLEITDFESAEAYYDELRKHTEKMGGMPGIPTGIEFIDASYPTGMRGGHFIIPIGWPGKAKTWVTSWIACNAFAAGFNPMIFSLEMSGADMRNRIYTMLGEGLFSATGFARGDVDLDNFREWAQKSLTQGNSFKIINRDSTQAVTPMTVMAKAEQYAPDLLIIDYAQMMYDNRQTEHTTSRMFNLCGEIDGLADVLDIPIVLITAATAEEKRDRKQPPMLSDVSWSKAFEYAADLSYAVHRNDETGDIEIVGRKNRHGELFSGFLQADLDKGIWEEVFS